MWDSRGRFTTEDFIKQAKEKYGDLYDYSKVKYKATNIKVCIICKEHGEFWQTPNKHLQGQGCPYCADIHNASEYKLYSLLKEKYPNKTIVRQYYNKEMFGLKKLDFLIKEDNIAIEYQGSQHFKPVKIYGGYNGFLDLCRRDKEKYEECKNNGIKLFYFTFEKNIITENYIDKVYFNIKDLFNEIDFLMG